MRKSETNSKAKLLTGFISILTFATILHLLNVTFLWHPLNLNLPLGKCQSFETNYEPYKWETASPDVYGYHNEIFSNYFDKLDKWDRLRGLLIVKEDKLIVEKYFAGETSNSAFNVHSITKSITSVLVRLSIQHNYIQSEYELVLPFFPEYKNHEFSDLKKMLTLKDLLTMRSSWAGGDAFQTVEKCILSIDLAKKPDTEFHYFTGSQNILSAIITKNTKQTTKEFANQYLFEPLRIQNGFWREIEGYYVGGDESYYTPRDLARLGQLFLNRGSIDGKQLLDKTWIDKTFTNYTNSSNEFRSLASYDEVGYGFCWWIFKDKDNNTIYAARGRGGQHIILMPDKEIMVIIVQEWNPFKKKNEALENELLGELLRIINKS